MQELKRSMRDVLQEELEATAEKHLGSSHDQQTHGWRHSSLAAAQRTVSRLPPEKRSAFMKRAEERLTGVPKPSKTTTPTKTPEPKKITPEKPPVAKPTSTQDKLNQQSKAARDNITAIDDKYGKKIATLERQYRQAGGEHTDYGREKGESLKKLKEKRNAEIRKELYVDNPSNINASVKIKDKQMGDEALSEFNKLVDRSVMPADKVSIESDTSGRSFYHQKSGNVKMSGSYGSRAIVHELGHWIEDKNPSVRDKVHEFLAQRTKGDDTIDLSKATKNPNYGKGEVAKVDKFVNAYMGKQYVNASGKRYATEILSMGLEMFFADAGTLARQDPEFFDFIFMVVRGG